MKYSDRLPTEPTVWLLTLFLASIVGSFLYVALQHHVLTAFDLEPAGSPRMRRRYAAKVSRLLGWGPMPC